MATKELSLIVKAIDQMSPTMGSLSAAAIGAFHQMELRADKTRETLERLGEPFKKLRDYVWDLLKAPGDSFVAEAIKKAIEGTVDEVAAIGSLSNRLGLATDLLGKLRYAAKLSGGDLSSVAESVAHFEKNLVQFSEFGTGRAKEAFELLDRQGLHLKGTYEDLGAVLPKLADALHEMSPERQQFITQRLFGDNAQLMLKLLQGGGAGLDAKFLEAAKLHVVFTDEQIEKAHEYELATRRVEQAWIGLREQIAEQVEPFLTGFLNRAAEQIADMPAKIKNVGSALLGLVSEDPAARDNAWENVKSVAMAAVTLIGTGLVESAKVAAEVFVDTLLVVLRAAGPSVTDWATDVFGPILNQIPRVHIPRSLGGQLADAQASLSQSRGLLDVKSTELGNLEISGAGPQQDQAELEMEAHARKLRQDIEDLRRLVTGGESTVRQLAGQVHAQELNRTKDLSAAIQYAGERIPERFRQARDKIAAAAQGLQDAIATSGIYGPPAPEDSSAADERARRLSEQRLARAREAQEALLREQSLAAGKAQDEQFDQLVSVGKLLREQQHAALAAADPRGAERQKILERVGQQVGALDPEKLGPLYAGAAAAVNQWGDALLHAYDGETELDKVVSAAGGEYEKYRETLERVAEEVQAGNLQKFQASRINQEEADSVRGLLVQERARLEALKVAYPELTKKIEEQEAAITGLIKKVGLASRVKPDTFLGGASDGLIEFKNRVDDVGQQGRDAMLHIADTANGALADAIFQAAQHFDHLGDIAKAALRSIATEIGHVAAQFAANQIFSGLLGAIGVGGGAGFGGVGLSDSQALAGFGVPGFAAYAAGGARAYAAPPGGGGGGAAVVVHQTNNISGGGVTAAHLAAVKQSTYEGLADALKRNPSMKAGVVRELR